MSNTRLLILAAAAAPALMLAACKKHDAASGTAAAPAGPIAPAPAGGWVEQVTKTADGGYLMGNPQAPVRVIEYGSRTCPHCAAFATEGLPKLKSDYLAGGRVSYEFRDFAIHAPDLAAILLGRCGGAQPFFPILEQMFADLPRVDEKLTSLPPAFTQSLQGKTAPQQAAMWADQLGYTAFVGQRGVPAAKAQACLADTAAIDALGQQMADGTKRFDISGTPTFVINGEVASGVHDFATLQTALDAALKG